MKLDTLSYKYHYKSLTKDIYQVLISEQLKYFQSNNPSIKNLEPGTKILVNLQTKIRKLNTKNYMRVKNIKKDEEFTLETDQPSGEIIQSYKFMKNNSGKNILQYSEQNIFEDNRNQMNFAFFGLLYKFFYNHGVKKRMQYLDRIASNLSKEEDCKQY